MDSLTQILLGGAVAAAVAPHGHRRAALLAGAALGTFPDLDVFPIALWTDDQVQRVTLHRGLTHSLLVLPWIGLALWAWLRTRGGRVAQSPGRWFVAIELALLTHPVLDAFTVYGTQLSWPLATPPVMWSSMFIIDPLYTVWLLLGCVVAWFARGRRAARIALVAGLALSSGYLGFSLAAKAAVERHAGSALAALGLGHAPRISVPMPFTTLLWRVLVMTPDGYLEGEWSLVADRGPMQFRHYRADPGLRAEAAALPAARRLDWFTQGFWKAEERDGKLVLSDLRMGAEPDYVFRYLLAVREGGEWRAVRPAQVSWPDRDDRALARVWERIWAPAVPAAGRADPAAPGTGAR